MDADSAKPLCVSLVLIRAYLPSTPRAARVGTPVNPRQNLSTGVRR
jgi:hypothetical protein